ncbi:putative MFS-type transporter [Colletotrichum siamense]|uniref:MFS-type transporter n=1 Tax=Colletotrichum siamense TaxID=690259 RepID=A0A9P5K5L2_COLSI|nr:putative MFS-type transporter [Colletotrichum siamense]KAF4859829.1 putative MFS-type transporter [Colletotrichum siamense]
MGIERSLSTQQVDSTHQHTPDQETVSLGPDSRIEHVYLTFDTRLPEPVLQSQSQPENTPPRPNLQSYNSPLEWSPARKWLLLTLACTATFLTSYTAGAYAPPIPLMQIAFNSSHLAVLSGLTTFTIGFAISPMVLAPFSEINGRYPVFAASAILYTASQIACGGVTSLAGMLVARFFTGVGASVFSTMVGGFITDLWAKENRNTPMAIFSGAGIVGTGAGPMAAAAIVHFHGNEQTGAGWEWVFWHMAILTGATALLLLVFMRESRGPVLLSRKANALNKWYEELEQLGTYGVVFPHVEPDVGSTSPGLGSQPRRIRWVVKEDEDRISISHMITISVCRPFRLLFTEPVVFFFALWLSFAWAVLFLTFESIAVVYERVYQMSPFESSPAFSSLIVGGTIATILCIWLESLLHVSQWQGEPADPTYAHSNFWTFMRCHFPVDVPESRLYFTCITTLLLPIGLFLFGFLSRPEIHHAVPAVAIGIATIGIYSVYLATFNYIADTYGPYASSALAAQSLCRNIMGGTFPLITTILFQNLGEKRAGGLLGGIATALGIVPWMLVFFGERIRKWSKFAQVSMPQSFPSCRG